MDQNIMILWIVAWLSALGFAFWKLRWVESQSQGTEEIAKIAGHIRDGWGLKFGVWWDIGIYSVLVVLLGFGLIGGFVVYGKTN
jgi:Na+/H+-translocating membrane pyrophosphatase